MTLLETRGLTKRFGSLTAVHQMDLRVPPGERHAVIGPNGAGKTTLFHVITGRLKPTAGTVHFRGTEITGLPPHVVARQGLARSFQITNIFPHLTVRENVRLAVQAQHRHHGAWLGGGRVLVETARRADALLDLLGLAHEALSVAGTLSYGDQRHLEIGLALATDPALLLLDEPTAGMSPRETQGIVALLGRIPRQVTIVLIEHDMDVVLSLSDRVTVMHLGELLAQGTPEDVERDPRVQEAYFGGETRPPAGGIA